MHESARNLMTNAVNRHVLSRLRNGDVLEVGARKTEPKDWSPRALFGREWGYKGLDIRDGLNVDLVVEELGAWPETLKGRFDVVVSANTLEHCRRPWEVVRHMFEALKPEGTLVFVAPFAWPLHDHPGDFFRFTGAGLGSLIEAAGGKVIESGECECESWKVDAFAIGRKI